MSAVYTERHMPHSAEHLLWGHLRTSWVGNSLPIPPRGISDSIAECVPQHWTLTVWDYRLTIFAAVLHTSESTGAFWTCCYPLLWVTRPQTLILTCPGIELPRKGVPCCSRRPEPVVLKKQLPCRCQRHIRGVTISSYFIGINSYYLCPCWTTLLASLYYLLPDSHVVRVYFLNVSINSHLLLILFTFVHIYII